MEAKRKSTKGQTTINKTHTSKDRVTQPNNQILLAPSLWFPEFKQLQGTKYETRPIPKIQWVKKLLCHAIYLVNTNLLLGDFQKNEDFV